MRNFTLVCLVGSALSLSLKIEGEALPAVDSDTVGGLAQLTTEFGPNANHVACSTACLSTFPDETFPGPCFGECLACNEDW